MKKILFLMICIALLNCNNKNTSINKNEYKSNSKIESVFSFPDTVKVGEMNLAILTFYNPTFDTIVLPTNDDKKKFRYLLFSEFESINFFDEKFYSNNKVFKDSVLLYDREIYIGYEFDKIGIYEIGGLVKDHLIYDYSYIKSDSMQLYKAYSLITKTVVVTN